MSLPGRPGEEKICAGSTSGKLHVWRSDTLELLFCASAHSGMVYRVSRILRMRDWAGDSRLCPAGLKGSARADFPIGRTRLGRRLFLRQRVREVLWHATEPWLASCGKDKCIVMTSADTQEVQRESWTHVPKYFPGLAKAGVRVA